MNEKFTPEQMLSEVNKAIQTVIVGGQSYNIGSWSVTRANLSQLRAMRKELQAQINNSEGSALMPDAVVAVFEGR